MYHRVEKVEKNNLHNLFSNPSACRVSRHANLNSFFRPMLGSFDLPQMLVSESSGKCHVGKNEFLLHVGKSCFHMKVHT